VSMKKVAVVTDSVACLAREIVNDYNIEIIPINFLAGGKIYRDWVDITPTEAYKIFLSDPDSFDTSAASPKECFEAFQAAAKRAPNVFCVTVSGKLSHVYDSAVDAVELARTELPGVKIEVLDSMQATSSEGMIALAAARAAAEGKGLPEVKQAAEKIKEKVNAIFLLDTIKHVYRSGRIPKIASQMGSMLNIKPLLTISETVHFTGMARSRKKGIERMLQMMRNKLSGSPACIAVTHAYAPEEAEELKERILEEFNCKELWLSEFSPVMGYACGTGTIGISFYPDDTVETGKLR
jgi:DegV family protein with EDD domain